MANYMMYIMKHGLSGKSQIAEFFDILRSCEYITSTGGNDAEWHIINEYRNTFTEQSTFDELKELSQIKDDWDDDEEIPWQEGVSIEYSEIVKHKLTKNENYVGNNLRRYFNATLYSNIIEWHPSIKEHEFNFDSKCRNADFKKYRAIAKCLNANEIITVDEDREVDVEILKNDTSKDLSILLTEMKLEIVELDETADTAYPGIHLVRV